MSARPSSDETIYSYGIRTHVPALLPADVALLHEICTRHVLVTEDWYTCPLGGRLTERNDAFDGLQHLGLIRYDHAGYALEWYPTAQGRRVMQVLTQRGRR